MPRRANLQVAIQQPEFPDFESQNLSTLRKQWRWAAFGQFFFTFSPVFAMDDITLAVRFPWPQNPLYFVSINFDRTLNAI